MKDTNNFHVCVAGSIAVRTVCLEDEHLQVTTDSVTNATDSVTSIVTQEFYKYKLTAVLFIQNLTAQLCPTQNYFNLKIGCSITMQQSAFCNILRTLNILLYELVMVK